MTKLAFPWFFMFIVIIWSSGSTPAQTDSLLQTLAKSENKEEKAWLHFQLMHAYEGRNLPKTFSHGQKAYALAKEHASPGLLAEIQIDLGGLMARKGDARAALDTLLRNGLAQARKLKLDTLIPQAHGHIAVALITSQTLDSAHFHFDRAIALADSLGDIKKTANYTSNKAFAYMTQSNYPKGIETAFEAVALYERMQDSTGIGDTYQTIAIMYDQWGNPNDAMQYFREALRYVKASGNIRKVSEIYNSIGMVLKKQQQPDSALTYFRKAINKARELQAPRSIAIPMLSMAELYEQEGQYQQSLKATRKAMARLQKINYTYGLTYGYLNYGRIYQRLGQYPKALENFTKSLEGARKANMRNVEMKSLRGMANAQEAMGQTARALQRFRGYAALKDSLFSAEKAKQIENMKARYETEKKEQQIKLQSARLEKNEAEIKRQEARARMLYALLAAVLITIVVFAIGYYEKRKAERKIRQQRDEIREKHTILEQQNEEIRTQTEHLEQANSQISAQKAELEESHKHISDSIRYASRIQRALLPSEDIIRQQFPDYFIYWEPRDVVSGDFYWARQVGSQTLIAAADCTGHGVPGAFVSMLGIAFLNEIVRKGEVQTPGDVLNELRAEIKRSLGQEQGNNSVQDGMDIAFLSINHKSRQAQFAGAHNPLILVRQNGSGEPELLEYKADRQPVSTFIKEKPFATQEVNLMPGDRLYMFSDGFADQIGGPKGKKFYKKQLKRLILDVQDSPMEQQHARFKETLEGWQGSTYTQVDDVLLMGLEFQPDETVHGWDIS